MDPFVDAVISEMASRRLTNRKLADLSGVHRLVIGRWLNGQRRIGSDDLGRLMAVLGLLVVHRRQIKATHTQHFDSNQFSEARPSKRPSA